MVLKKYRSKAAYEKASAFIHIHNVPHKPQKEVLIAGKPHYPKHTGGEKVGHCANCGATTHTHFHAGRRCCGSALCCMVNSTGSYSSYGIAPLDSLLG